MRQRKPPGRSITGVAQAGNAHRAARKLRASRAPQGRRAGRSSGSRSRRRGATGAATNSRSAARRQCRGGLAHRGALAQRPAQGRRPARWPCSPRCRRSRPGRRTGGRCSRRSGSDRPREGRHGGEADTKRHDIIVVDHQQQSEQGDEPCDHGETEFAADRPRTPRPNGPAGRSSRTAIIDRKATASVRPAAAGLPPDSRSRPA